MKTAVLWDLNKELDVRDDVTLTDLGPGEVHVKINDFIYLSEGNSKA